MTPRAFLLLMTAVAVVGDALLHPFYPQYLQTLYGVSEPTHVGAYVAATSLTVFLAFPAWALLSRKVPVLRLLLATQSLAALFALAASAAPSLAAFWGLSLGMMIFKASYLLIYPYVMSLEGPESHTRTIGLLAFVAYFGHIISAFAAGLVFELLGPRNLFVAMAAADLIQLALCGVALKTAEIRPQPSLDQSERRKGARPRFFYELGLVMLVLYFSAYLAEPFFSEYWEMRAESSNRVLSGLVFAIPGFAALAALAVNARRGERDSKVGLTPMVFLALAGLALQTSALTSAIVVGRAVYGWALLNVMVRLDLLVFRASAPEDYAVDFSRVNVFQGLGVMLASSCAGTLVRVFGLTAPFVLAIAGFGLGALLFSLALGRHAERPLARTPPAKEAFTP